MVFSDLFISDQEGDTLIYVEKIFADAAILKFNKKNIELNELELQSPHFHLKKDSMGLNSLQYLIDFFKKENSKNDDWNVVCDELKIRDGHFSYKDASNRKRSSDQVNFKNIELRDLQFKAVDVSHRDLLTDLHIEHLSFMDHSGFELKELSAKVLVDTTRFEFSDLTILTPYSDIAGYHKMSFKTFSNLNKFQMEVSHDLHLNQSIVHLEDLNFFSGSFNHFANPVAIDGHFKGTMNDFEFENIHLEAGNYTSFRGFGSVRNVLDKDKMHMKIEANVLKTHFKDMEQIVLFPLSMQGIKFEVPENLKALGRVNINGNFVGTLRDFKTNGHFNSALGSTSGDMQINRLKGTDQVAFNGFLKTENFELGKILDVKDLGLVSMEGRVQGTGTSLPEMQSALEVNMISIEYRGHKYENVAMNGELAQNKFNGKFNIDQADLRADFDGNLDFTSKTPLVDFIAVIDHADLSALNLIESNKSSSLSGTIRADLVGLEMDNVLGTVEYDSLIFSREEESFVFGKGKAEFFNEDSVRYIEVRSDILDADISGFFKIKNIDDVVIAVLSTHIPSVSLTTPEEEMEYTYLDFNLLFRDLDAITSLLAPNVSISRNAALFGEFNNFQNKFDFVFNADTVRVGKTQFVKIYSEGVQNEQQGYFYWRNKRNVIRE